MRNRSEPYAVIGAGDLNSHVWKRGDKRNGFVFQFTFFRIDRVTGEAHMMLDSSDLPNLVKLFQVIASSLLDDSEIEDVERKTLRKIACGLKGIGDQLS